jgi:accessory gene regulator B
MEKLANRIAESVARSAGLDDERKKVVAYGLGALLQMLFLMVASLIFGLVFHCLPESMTIFLAVGLFKRSAGGAHSRTSSSCNCISLASIFLMSLFSRYAVPVVPTYWLLYLAFAALTFTAATITVYRRAPVSSPNKPIVRKEKIQRLRRLSFLTIGVFLALCIAMILLGKTNPRYINAAVSLCMAVLWQSFMLTGAASRFLSFLDSSVSAG